MIHYRQFRFAAAPRTGTAWFVRACQIAGLGERTRFGVHEPPIVSDATIPVVSIVRHPFDWLVSYWSSLRGGFTGTAVVDRFVPWVRLATNLEHFIEICLEKRGCVGGMFDAYRADVVLKTEELNVAAVELFRSFGVGRQSLQEIYRMPPLNVGASEAPTGVDAPHLRRWVVESEYEFCERYDYHA